MKLVDKRLLEAAGDQLGLPLAWRRARSVCESSPTIAVQQLDWLPSFLEPPPVPQAQAPVSEPECPVPGSAQLRKAAGVDMVAGGLRVLMRLSRHYTYPGRALIP